MTSKEFNPQEWKEKGVALLKKHRKNKLISMKNLLQGMRHAGAVEEVVETYKRYAEESAMIKEILRKAPGLEPDDFKNEFCKYHILLGRNLAKYDREHETGRGVEGGDNGGDIQPQVGTA